MGHTFWNSGTNKEQKISTIMIALKQIIEA